MEFVSLALAASNGQSASMATLEKRSDSYRAIFYYGGQRFSRSLKTKSQKAAAASLARLEDNVRRAELGLLSVPDDVDIASYLLSDGRLASKPEVPTVHSMQALFKNYFASIPEDSLEECSKKGMRIHVNHLERIIGKYTNVHALEAAQLQQYIVERGKEDGIRGRKVSAATIKKELVTFRTIWNWSMNMGILKKRFPNRGLRFPKLHEKPPFQTIAEIRDHIANEQLSEAEQADLWDAAFLTLPEIVELLDYVKKAPNTPPFVYPMFVFAAHTGARRSEMIRSQLRDIDLKAGTVLVHERKRVPGKQSTRRVPLTAELREVLKTWLAGHPGGKFTFCHRSAGTQNRTSHRCLTVDEVHDNFKKVLKLSQWSKLRGWHLFRHSFCSNCAARGVDQRIINSWVGHQTEEMVKRYRHLIPNQEQEAIATVFG